MIKTGCKDLDELIEGYKEEITCIYGAPASGKTTLALLATIEQSKNGKKILFLDTENGFSVERFIQLCGNKELLKNVFLIKISDFEEQCKKIDGLMNIIDMFSLVIIDTIGTYYRGLVKDDPIRINRKLDRQLQILGEISRKRIPVLILNQVYFNIDKNKINIVGGDMLENFSDCLIELEKKPKRRIIVRKPFEKEILFKIKGDGVFKC